MLLTPGREGPVHRLVRSTPPRTRRLLGTVGPSARRRSDALEARRRRGLNRSPAPTGSAPVVAAVTDDSDGRATVTVRGHVTGLDAGGLDGTLVAALQRSRAGLDLDLSQVTYCDAAGLRMLLDVREQALASGRTVLVTAAGDFMGRLLATTGTARLFSTGTDPAGPDGAPLASAVRTTLLRSGFPLTDRPGVPGFLHVRPDGDAVDVVWGTGGDHMTTRAADRVLGDAVAGALTGSELTIEQRTDIGVRAVGGTGPRSGPAAGPVG
ncbi:STAS domain-containing protein [Streptomyces sp. HNM0645]|uniref:STAS domain-containing protein n=1 Tax=Streptomyces sp. HNM0645 TaxID=2782343 RepID=UPI0024B7C594|nr:STAS domain-containing protein [Streptomyces sp. HNM0645]MDI9883665.1 STAS domain-containing protein [Streptomyces sp. HNM0645]